MTRAAPLAQLRGLFADPVFRRELRRLRAGAWAGGLGAAAACYVAALLLARLAWGSPPAAGEGIGAAFPAVPWLLAGATVLSLGTHWLVPPFLAVLPRPEYDLGLLTALLRAGSSRQRAFFAQVAARVLPLALGTAPLVLALPPVGLLSSELALPGACGLGAAVLWLVLAAGVSLWAGTRCRTSIGATCCAHALLTLVLPLAVGSIARFIGAECSYGRADHERVFWAAAGITWALLVVGLAGAFWDWTLLRLFPERRRSLWIDTPPPAPSE